MLQKPRALRVLQKILFFLFAFLILANSLYASADHDFPREDFWSLDTGFGMSDILVDGTAFQFIIDPKLWLSPALMAGSRLGINYSTEEDRNNILTFEGQVYLRWNFLQVGWRENPTNVFVQSGLGFLAAYRGWGANPFNDVTRTRGSLLFDVGAGVTIPLSSRWHIEPSIRSGYPHILGIALTAGYKFPLPSVTRTKVLPGRVEFVEVIKTVPANEIVKRVMISAVEYVIFGPDIGRYNIGIDADAQQLNEMVLDYTARVLSENPNYQVRIEGHANPYTISVSERDELQTLSAIRSNTVAEQLRRRGVSENQLVVISFGGTRTATTEWDMRNRNRRVELIIVQLDTN